MLKLLRFYRKKRLLSATFRKNFLKFILKFFLQLALFWEILPKSEPENTTIPIPSFNEIA